MTSRTWSSNLWNAREFCTTGTYKGTSKKNFGSYATEFVFDSANCIVVQSHTKRKGALSVNAW